MSMIHNYYRGRERRRVGILKKKRSALALMRSKRKFSLLILLTLFLLMVSPAFADLVTVNSRWAYTTPTINGTISSGEWTDATVVNFQFYMRKNDGSSNQTLDARFYVKNNLTHIDAAVQIFNEDFDAQDSIPRRYDSFGLLFEDNHTHTLENGDNGVGIHLYPSAEYANYDWYYDGAQWTTDKLAGKNNDGALNWSHTDPVEEHLGNYTFEMTIPFSTPDGDAYDLAIATLPRTVGFKIYFYEWDEQMCGVYPDDGSVDNNALEILDASTYGNLILHPRYYLTITTTAGGTTNPAPAVYDYGWGEVQSVSAIPSSGYVFDHWELDGGYAGSISPILVTMDMNHALKAFFKSAPPPTVGGMAAPIVIQINEPNLLTPLIWLASVIIPIALTVAFVKLKKKKL